MLEKSFASGVRNGKAIRDTNIFLTFSYADLRWSELLSVISKSNGFDIADENIDLMFYHERCHTLNKNLVLVASHFQYWVEVFFKDIVRDGPLGRTQYLAIRVKFQVRGNP